MFGHLKQFQYQAILVLSVKVICSKYEKDMIYSWPFMQIPFMAKEWRAPGLHRGLPGGLALSVCIRAHCRSCCLPLHLSQLPSHWFRTCLKVILWGRLLPMPLFSLSTPVPQEGRSSNSASCQHPVFFSGSLFLWCDGISTWFLSTHPSAALGVDIWLPVANILSS